MIPPMLSEWTRSLNIVVAWLLLLVKWYFDVNWFASVLMEEHYWWKLVAQYTRDDDMRSLVCGCIIFITDFSSVRSNNSLPL